MQEDCVVGLVRVNEGAQYFSETTQLFWQFVEVLKARGGEFTAWKVEIAISPCQVERGTQQRRRALLSKGEGRTSPCCSRYVVPLLGRRVLGALQKVLEGHFLGRVRCWPAGPGTKELRK